MTEINPSYTYNLYSSMEPSSVERNNEAVFKDFEITIQHASGMSSASPKIQANDIENLNFEFIGGLDTVEQAELLSQVNARLDEVQQEQDKSPTGEYKEELDKLQKGLETLKYILQPD